MFGGSVFKPLKNLQDLWLSGNYIPHKRVYSYYNHSLTRKNSRHFQLRKTAPVLLYDFASLSNLRNLVLTGGDTTSCYLPVLFQTSFELLRKTPVSSIHLNRCDIKQIEPYAFKDLYGLQTLNISNNYDLCGSIKNVFYGLNTTSIRALRMTSLCLKSPIELHSGGSEAKELSGTKLEELYIFDAWVTSIPSSFLDYLPKTLKILKFRKTFLDRFDSFKTYQDLNN